MRGDRLVGGLWCHEVLAVLSDYLDGELAATERDQVEAHVKECDVCERFGGEFASVVKGIRSALREPPPLDPDIAERLQEKILRSG
ncbi:MAG: zf-HC2 domain-containing protein [Thermoanaerobaculia bacterium]|jgi:anti-sigma factor RsiW